MGSLAGRAGDFPWSDLPVSGRAEVSPGSDLPLNRILYIPFSIFSYSSNIVIANLVRIESMLEEGTLKYSRFSLNSTSFRDRVPATKVQWCTTQPECCMTVPSADRRDSYCANAIPSVLLFQSRSSAICSWEIPCCLRIISARVNGRYISKSLVAFHSVCSVQ
jgi:hypothetical protein